MSQKMMLIVNPHSGKNGMKDHLQDIITLFHSHGWEVTVFPTHKSGDATEYAKERYTDFDLTVCCGGDGTLCSDYRNDAAASTVKVGVYSRRYCQRFGNHTAPEKRATGCSKGYFNRKPICS